MPLWTDNFIATVNGDKYTGQPGTFLSIDRVWNVADKIEVVIDISLKMIPDNNKGSKLVAVKRGPQILAIDENVNDTKGLPQCCWFGNQVHKFSANQDGNVNNFIMVPLADAG